MKPAKILRDDKWIRITQDAIIEKVITYFNRFMDNPNAETKELTFDFYAFKRDDGTHIKYPGPDGQEEALYK